MTYMIDTTRLREFSWNSDRHEGGHCRRMRKLGGSQPNLSTLVATDIPVSDDEDVDEDGFLKDDNSPKGLYPSLRQRVLSNPNLLDCDEPVKV